MDDGHLIVLPASGATFWAGFNGQKQIIGSAVEADVRIVDPEIAACHAVIERIPTGWVVTRHATPFQVNGRKVRQHTLAPFDLITLGRTALSVRPGADAPVSSVGGTRPSAVELCRKLNEFQQGVYGGATIQAVADRLLADLMEITGASRGTLLRFANQAESEHGPPDAVQGVFSSDEHEFSRTVVARMRDDGRPVLIMDTSVDPDLAAAPSIQQGLTRAVMCAPVYWDQQMIGALYVSTSARHGFGTNALELLSLYAQQAVHLLRAAVRDQDLTERLSQAVSRTPQKTTLVNSSAAMRDVLNQIRKVASTNIPVLLGGPTGTGKELAARELHRLSKYSKGMFVAVDCGAIPDALFEAELFGHKKGAFTGAFYDQIGFVRRAHGGTLFLDEIGEMPLPQQAKLLRVLQQRTVTPVGGQQSHDVDFRLISASNRDLEAEVKAGNFRQDLYYRLAGVAVSLPPLNQREDDAVELAYLFLARHRDELGRSNIRFKAECLTAIRRHPWPGNVRELEASIRKAIVLCDDDAIGCDALGLPTPIDDPEAIQPLTVARDTFLKTYVASVLEQLHGDRTEAAKRLMVSPRTLFKYLEEV